MSEPKLEPRFGLLQASALNMSNMIGIGPFITIPLLMSALGGPASMFGWAVALVIAIADGMVWINLSIIGVIPWTEFVPWETTKPVSDYVVSIFMERTWGRTVAVIFTLMVVWTAFGSVFALLLGYSRIPYAAAKAGDFFAPFAKLHPKNFRTSRCW